MSHGNRAISERYYAIVAHKEVGMERIGKKREMETKVEGNGKTTLLAPIRSLNFPAGETSCHKPFLARRQSQLALAHQTSMGGWQREV